LSMRKTVLAWAILALCLGFSTPTHAQNLVLNPSFEEMKGCPGLRWLGPTIDSAMHCFNLLYSLPLAEHATPDYNHDCVSPYFEQPYTIFSNGYWVETPRTGLAMAGFMTYQSDAPGYREYVGMTLSQPLQKDTTYYVSLYVSRADSMSYATDINVYFAWNIPVLDIPYALDSLPQITSSTIITNSIGWTKIEGSFIAKGGEKYLIIGNQHKEDKMKIKFISFFPIDTGLIPNDTIPRAKAYYNIDDVCVSTKSSDCEVSTSIVENSMSKQMMVYPNPAHTTLYIRDIPPTALLTLYNPKGELVAQLPSQNAISVAQYPEGLYFLHIITPTQRYVQKIIIQH